MAKNKDSGWETIGAVSSDAAPEVKASTGDWEDVTPSSKKGKDDGWSTIGAIEAVTTFIPKMGLGGLAGVAQAGGALAGGASLKEAGDELVSGFQKPQDASFFTPKATEYQRNAMELLGKGVHSVGNLVEDLGAPSGSEFYSNEEFEKARSTYGDPAAQLTTELAANFLPVPGARAIHNKFWGPTEVPKPVVEPPRQMAPEAYKADLFGTDQPSPIPPGVRSPYNLAPEEIARLEKELNPDVDQRVQGQGELFTDFARQDLRQAPLERALSEPTPGRNRVEQPPQVTDMGVQDASLWPDKYGDARGLRELPFERVAKQEYRPDITDTRTPERGGAPISDTELAFRTLREGRDPFEGRIVQMNSGFAPHEFVAKLKELVKTNPEYLPALFRRMFDPEAFKKAMEQSRDSNETLVFLNPKDFTRVAMQISNDRIMSGKSTKSLKSIRDAIQSQTPLRDIPVLEIAQNRDGSWQVVAHEGRHRSIAFATEGIPKIPVILRIVPGPNHSWTKLPKWGKMKPEDIPRTLWGEDTFLGPELSSAKNFISLPENQTYPKGINSLSSYADSLAIDSARPVARNPLGKGSFRQGGAVSIDRAAKQKGPVKALQETAREWKLDSRPIDQVIKEDLQGKDLKDFSPEDAGVVSKAMARLGSLVKENLLQDKTLSILTKNQNGTGPLIKWTVDQVSRIEREGLTKTKQAVDAALVPFRRMFRHEASSRAELAQAVKTWQENVGKRDLTRSDFKTDKQYKVYEAFQQQNDKILTELNEKRSQAGLDPIPRIPSYFHSMWEGDYRLFGRDAQGEKQWAVGFKTEAGAMKAMKAFEKKHPDLTWNTEHVTRDRYGITDLSAFEEAIRVMSKEGDPLANSLRKTYEEILQHKGFGKTGIHRKGVLGYLGSEAGPLGLKMIERSYEQYVTQAYRYMGNLDKQKVLGDLQKLPPDVKKQLPETYDFLYSYIRKSQGARLGEIATDKILASMSKAFGLGESGPITAVRQISSLASVYWLTTPKFWLSQSVQSFNILPKLLQDVGVVDGVTTFFDGWKNTITPDQSAKDAVHWAAERGYLDATVKNLIGKNLEEIPISSRFEASKEMLSYPASKIERSLVRTPVFLMMEKALRDTIKDPVARYEVAAEKMDYYMVNYGRTHAPMIYDKLGLAGELARPLKQYSHNTFGQFLEYAQGFKNRGELAPLATFFGVQAAMGGLKGMMFVAEATAIITLLNAIFDTDIPTPEKLLMKSNLPDVLQFGGLSAVLGYDVSGSVASPNLPNMLSFPAVSFTQKALVDGGGYLLKKLQGIETDQDRLRAAMAVFPNITHEWLKSVFTPEGMPTANPNDPMLRGNYRRTPDERFISSFLIGAKPLPEAKADAIMKLTRQELLRDAQQKLDAVEAITDRIQNGQEIDPKLFERYIKEGGDPARLSSTVVDRMKQRMLTGPERTQNFKTLTPEQFHKQQILQEYLNAQGKKMSTEAVESEESPHKPMMDADSRIRRLPQTNDKLLHKPFKRDEDAIDFNFNTRGTIRRAPTPKQRLEQRSAKFWT